MRPNQDSNTFKHKYAEVEKRLFRFNPSKRNRINMVAFNVALCFARDHKITGNKFSELCLRTKENLYDYLTEIGHELNVAVVSKAVSNPLKQESDDYLKNSHIIPDDFKPKPTGIY
jgi:hypothetical protein